LVSFYKKRERKKACKNGVPYILVVQKDSTPFLHGAILALNLFWQWFAVQKFIFAKHHIL
jgi:hypothetical protein